MTQFASADAPLPEVTNYWARNHGSVGERENLTTLADAVNASAVETIDERSWS
jgi:hypothetical protein